MNAAFPLTTGNCNTVVGSEAGDSMTTGGGNVVLGYWAGEDLTTGDDNVFVGQQAGRDQLTDGFGQLWNARDNTGNNEVATWIHGDRYGR